MDFCRLELMVAQEVDLFQQSSQEINSNSPDWDQRLPWREELGVHRRVAGRLLAPLMPDGPRLFWGRVLLGAGLQIVTAPVTCVFPPAAVGVAIAGQVAASRLEARARRASS